jgi:HSP20 family protein
MKNDQNESCCQSGACAVAENTEATSVASYRPAYTSRYDHEAWEVSVQLPGVKKDDLSVTVENEILEVGAILRAELPEGWRPLGKFEQEKRYLLRLDIGPEVDASSISRGLEDGVLTLRLPLRDELKPRRIEIQ